MRTKKAILNMATSMLYQIVAIICGLITPRLILSTFGSTYNGVVSSAVQYLSMINILNIGITGVTRVALYKTLAEGDNLGTSRIMKATSQYMRKVAGCLVIYALALSFIYPIISHNELSNAQCMSLILIVSLGTFAEYFFGLANQTLLQAAQASYITNALNIAKTIVNTICVAILIWFGSSIYIVKLGSSLVFFITPVVMNYIVKKRFHLTNHCEPDNSAIRNRGVAAVHTVSNIVHNNADLVILTVFADAKEISVYTVYYLVVGKVKSLMQVFTTGIEAAFGDMWVKREMDTLQKRFRTYEYMLFTFTAMVFSCVGILIIPFLKNYTSGINDVNYIRYPLAIIITVTEAAFCVRQPYLTLVYATGSYEETKNGAIAEAAINIGLSVLFVWLWGIEGVIIGTLAANIFRTAQFSIFISEKILHRSIMEVINRVIWLLADMGIIILLSILMISLMNFPLTWIGWLIEAVVVFCTSLVVTFIFSYLFYKKDMFSLVSTLFKIKKTK